MPADPSVEELGALLGGVVLGDAGLRIQAIRPLDAAQAHDISFLAHASYLARLRATRAGCVILSPAHRDQAAHLCSAIVVADPYLAYARLSQWWARRGREAVPAGIHPSAFVHADARVDPSARVGAFALIEHGVEVGEGAQIGPHVVLQALSRVGAGSQLHARVHLGARCQIGSRAVVHPGVVIGADGFGFAAHEGRWEKIEQLGAVRIGDDVEIGANTCIDRGALGDTVLADGVKLDNLIQIGHNVHIGEHTAMAGCVGIAGSARIGARCTLGGGAIVLGHLEIVDDVHISAATVVTRSISRPGQYSGVFPFDENARWEKNAATLRHLHELRQRLRLLEGPKA